MRISDWSSDVCSSDLMNPNHVICTLDRDATLSMELTVETGKGYVPASANRPEDAPIGLIPVDAVFSPVRQVAYKVDNTRLGQVTDYEKLRLPDETDGSLTQEDRKTVAPGKSRSVRGEHG